MCSPEFKKQAGKLQSPADLLNFTLIHTERNLLTWKMWFADRDITALQDLRGVCLDPSELAIDAAVRDIGIVLESDMLAAQELENGALVPAIENSESEIVSYYLVYPEEYEGLPKITAFSDWIIKLANADLVE
jgi:LysR family glycine cleavage system transcriptional activator